MAGRPLAEIAEAAFAGGCRWVLIREKDLSGEALAALVRKIRARAAPHGALVTVSGAADAAAEAGADGVHLPQAFATEGQVATARARLGAESPVGISAHSRMEAEAAQRLGADYVTLSPVFLTESKPGYGPALGARGFARETRGLAIPALALAGVTAENLSPLKRSGAAGFAVMGAVMRADDPSDAMRQLLDAWHDR